MADIGDLRYDRSVTDAFASLFQTGCANSLVDYARGKYPIDFQYRKSPKTEHQWATLYVGLTAVVNVHDKGLKGLALDVHKTYQDPTLKLGWQDKWSSAAPAETWADRWPQVEAYLERAIPKIVTDGRYQCQQVFGLGIDRCEAPSRWSAPVTCCLARHPHRCA